MIIIAQFLLKTKLEKAIKTRIIMEQLITDKQTLPLTGSGLTLMGQLVETWQRQTCSEKLGPEGLFLECPENF